MSDVARTGSMVLVWLVSIRWIWSGSGSPKSSGKPAAPERVTIVNHWTSSTCFILIASSNRTILASTMTRFARVHWRQQGISTEMLSSRWLVKHSVHVPKSSSWGHLVRPMPTGIVLGGLIGLHPVSRAYVPSSNEHGRRGGKHEERLWQLDSCRYIDVASCPRTSSWWQEIGPEKEKTFVSSIYLANWFGATRDLFSWKCSQC